MPLYSVSTRHNRGKMISETKAGRYYLSQVGEHSSQNSMVGS